jgi:maleamate amidohydrolase
MREWEQFIPEDERKMYEKAGYKGKQEFGRNPALLIIDVITGFTGTKPMDVMDAIDEFPTSCGKVAWDALPNIQKLLHACRDVEIPVIYSTSDPDFKAAFGNATKRGVDATDFEKLATEFPDMIKPREGEFIVRKARASAFFGTHLITYLVRKNIDCLLVTGTSTCGCVRGTVLDGYSYGYSVFPVEECIFDRSRTSHLVNLFEMNAKYSTVIQLEEAMKYVQGLRRIEGRQAIAR